MTRPDETGDAGPATLARRRAPDTLAAPGQRLRRRRMSAKRKQSAILRLLRGETLELVSRESGGRLSVEPPAL
jgi:hypothetical protein